MRIYTKTGDRGETSLFGGTRVGKDNLRVDAYGTLDELNALLGLARSIAADSQLAPLLERLQSELFTAGSELACSEGKAHHLGIELIATADIQNLETTIDSLEAELVPLAEFILPGGCPLAAALHHARTVCRRAERATVALSRTESISNELLVYLNRLGDLLFVTARYANHETKVREPTWKKRVRST
jgi:cob(I)alamin adenosyltransferase